MEYVQAIGIPFLLVCSVFDEAFAKVNISTVRGVVEGCELVFGGRQIDPLREFLSGKLILGFSDNCVKCLSFILKNSHVEQRETILINKLVHFYVFLNLQEVG